VNEQGSCRGIIMGTVLVFAGRDCCKSDYLSHSSPSWVPVL